MNDLQGVLEVLILLPFPPFRRYAEELLDILIAGGQLAPGGKIESSVRSSMCVFTCEPMVEALKEHVQVSVFNTGA